jgi:TolB protein
MMRKTFTLAVVAAVFAVLSISAEPQGQPPAPQPAPQQPSEVGVIITGDTGAAPRYAVPEFVALTANAAEAAKTLGQVLWDDLNFEKEFQLIARDTAASIPVGRTPEQIAFSDWREIGADAVFFGTVEQKGDEIRVQVRLFNVQTRQSVFGEEYTGRARSARLIAHTVSDAVHLQQRGLTGVARTKLTFISDRNNESILGTVEKRTVKEVYISDYDGANEQRITTTRQLNVSPTWGADSRVLLYATDRNSTWEFVVSLLATGQRQVLTRGRPEFRDGAYNPVFSRDGKQILFAMTPVGESAQEIFVMNADGSGLRRITRNPAIDTSPTWSPSGTRIAFVSTRAGRQQIYTMNLDGSNLELVRIPDGEVDRPTWAPAPYNEIAYSARTGAGYDIKVHDLTTGATRQLTFGEGSNESPAYSKTGRHLAFTSTRAGRVQVFTIARDGTGVRQITRAGNNTWPNWSN